MRRLGLRLPLLVLCSIAFATEAVAQQPALTPATGSISPEATRHDFLRLIDRPRVAPDVEETAMPAPAPDLVESHLAFTSEPGQRVPALVVKPATATGRLPVVIVLHGTGGRKEDNLDTLERIARAGMIGVAPDGRYHGERSAEGHGTKSYYVAIAQAYRDGKSHPWLYDTVYDVMRLIDVLQTRPDVDPARIGLMGFSKGGMECYLTAAVDPRIKVAVPCICLQSFRWELDHDQWHHRIGTVQGGFDAASQFSHASPADPAFVQHFYDRLVPGIDSEFDCPAMLTLIAPRPMLAISGEKDPINPLPCAQLAADTARAAYAADGSGDDFQFIVQKGVAHAVNEPSREAAVAWLKRWLKTE